MVIEVLLTKFDSNLLDGVWENEFYGQTRDGRTPE